MSNRIISKKADTFIKVILFFISPFISFLYSLRNIKSNSSYIVFFLFAVFFGMAFTIPENYKGDAIFYQLRFIWSTGYDYTDFKLLLHDYFEFSDKGKDIYSDTISFLVSRISDNYHLLFCIFAAIFAFFMLKSFRFLTREQALDNSFISFLLTLIFILSNFIFNINGVRFWTASWIAVYSIFQIFKNNDKRYFLLACVTPLIHVSFFAFIVVLVISYITKKYDKFWIFMFLISFLVSNIAANLVSSLGDYLPGFMSNTVSRYTNADYMTQRVDELVMYVKIIYFIQKLIFNLVILLFVINRKLILSSTAKNLYSFLIIWVTFVNITISIPSFGGRFLILSLPIITYIWLVTFKNNLQYKTILYLFVIAFSYNFFQQIRGFFQVTEIYFYIFNPFYLIYNYLLT